MHDTSGIPIGRLQRACRIGLLDANHTTGPRGQQVIKIDLPLNRVHPAIDVEILLVKVRAKKRGLDALRLFGHVRNGQAVELVRHRNGADGNERRNINYFVIQNRISAAGYLAKLCNAIAVIVSADIALANPHNALRLIKRLMFFVQIGVFVIPRETFNALSIHDRAGIIRRKLNLPGVVAHRLKLGHREGTAMRNESGCLDALGVAGNQEFFRRDILNRELAALL